ncbi:Murein DD-endopeptidase MepM [Tsuneonella dongtanensis]|uniref:Murein DD-endopeptidase MepM n=1 Tax=Tsuneonella dongtanensis TaxID=692370 RepID=A0A1B2ABH2_9SPHN|nr:peptidoglycan DD-metalloendopeptidase family protein [Tsuneonella dongtanensis]ANY19385.1 Murein DD-endopeptidase MepM [Tsuneonella dongtanensis]
MNNDTTSFDPKTWLEEKSAARETASFDPKTWAGAGETAPPESDPPSTAQTGRRLPTAVFAAAGLVAALGGGAWLWSGGNEELPVPDEVPSRSATATPAPKPVAGEPPRIVTVRNLQNLTLALEQMGVPLADAVGVARETVGALGVEDQEMRVEVVLDGKGDDRVVKSIIAELSGGSGVRLTRQTDGSYAREENLLNESTKIRSAEGKIRHATFYASAIEAGIPDSLITPFAKAFSFDFDFQREVKQGDRFLAVWEERVTPQGRRLGPPRLVYAEMGTGVGERAYYAFTPPDEVEPRWFDAQGNGAARGLMRTPVDGARLTSGFGTRVHPIRGFVKKHNGTDFAAPTGTPIYASGSATVAAVAPNARCAGNLVKLQHNENMQTWYMHMVRFADGLTQGQTVNQGDVIGYVGTTGCSTGPHLHYEVRIDGEPIDPMTFETTKVEPLVGEAKTMFLARRAEIDAARE